MLAITLVHRAIAEWIAHERHKMRSQGLSTGIEFGLEEEKTKIWLWTRSFQGFGPDPTN